ncbi:hypothetical protein AOLI_G00176680 [Acnodon oligacanthus]
MCTSVYVCGQQGVEGSCACIDRPVLRVVTRPWWMLCGLISHSGVDTQQQSRRDQRMQGTNLGAPPNTERRLESLAKPQLHVPGPWPGPVAPDYSHQLHPKLPRADFQPTQYAPLPFPS